MRRYKIRIYGVPDKHLYAPLPARAWYTFRTANRQRKAAMFCAGTAFGLLCKLVVTLLWIR